MDVWLEVTDQTETVAEEEKAKVEEAGKELGSDYRVGAYMDLKLWKQVAGKQATKVEEVPNGKVKVSFTIPKQMRKDNATYVIIGLHNGKTFVLKTTLDKTIWRISFETNQFSTYALAYQEQEPETKKSVTEIFPEPNELPHISAHILRHTACSRFAESGLDPKTLQIIMGHSNVTTTLDVYTHLDFTKVKKKIEEIDDRIRDIE